MLEVPYWPSKLTKYSENRAKGMNMSEAAREAGYSPALIKQSSVRLEPKHQWNIKEALQQSGVTNERLAVVINNGLNASRVDGSVDFRERREYTKLALEATGELKTGNTVAVQINFPAGLAEILAKDAEEYDPSK